MAFANAKVKAPGSTFNIVSGDQYNIHSSFNTHSYNVNSYNTNSFNSNSNNAYLNNNNSFNHTDKSTHYHFYPNATESELKKQTLTTSCAAPSSSDLFVGRDIYLGHLRKFFFGNSLNSRLKALLYGMGGVGKTQIGLKFLELYTELYNDIFWIDASNIETINSSLLAIGMTTEFASSGMDLAPSNILRWISSLNSSWIAVYDNADTLSYHALESYFPLGNRGNILITSRNQHLARIVHPNGSWEVEEMPLPDAVQLLIKSAHLPSSEQYPSVLEAICLILHCFPLALDQAGALISNNVCTLYDFIRMHKKHRHQLMSDEHFKGASQYGRALYVTWDMSYDELKRRATSLPPSPAAQTAISLIGIIASFGQVVVPEEMFSRAAKNIASDMGIDLKGHCLSRPDEISFLAANISPDDTEWDALHFRRGIEQLKSFSLISSSTENFSRTYYVHPLIRDWCVDKQMRLPSPQALSSVSSARWVLTQSLCFEEDTILERTFGRLVAPHIEHLCEIITRHDQDESYTTMECRRMGELLWRNGVLKQALKLHRLSHQIYLKHFGPRHLDTLQSMGDLASTLLALGHLADAKDIHLQLIEVLQQISLDKAHPLALQNQEGLALVLSALGDHRQAKMIQIAVMETRTHNLGPRHPDTLRSQANLASTLSALGHFQDAKELEDDVLNARIQVLGKGHPDTLTSMSNLASTLSALGRYTEAETLASQVLNITRGILGVEHPETLRSMGNLSATLSLLGRYDEAQELQAQLLELSKRLLGEEHPETLRSMANLASIVLQQGHLLRAADLLKQVMDISKTVMGPEHIDTLRSMNDLASTLAELNRLEDAQLLQEQVLEIHRRLLGSEHPDVITSMSNLAATLSDLRRWPEAEQLQLRVLEIRRRVLGKEHPDTLISMNNLASTLTNIPGRLQEAEQLQIEVLDITKRILGADHPNTLTAMHNLALSYRSLNRLREAEVLQVEVLELSQRILGPSHPRTLVNMMNLASTLSARSGRQVEVEAEEILSQARERFRELELEQDAQHNRYDPGDVLNDRIYEGSNKADVEGDVDSESESDEEWVDALECSESFA